MRFLCFIVLLQFALFSCQEPIKKKRVLPIFGNYDLEYSSVDGEKKVDTLYHKIPQIKYLNEDSIWKTNKDFENKLWIVEFFFATCPTVCPAMNLQLKKLNQELKAYENDIQFMSFTINPKHDTPSILKQYKQKTGITAKNWTFLSGDEDETHNLGIKSFLTFAGKDEDSEGGFAHSGSFTLVDKEGHVRGVYRVTDLTGKVDSNEYNRMKSEILKLLNDEYNIKK
ncbi:MAG: SCO family protein [Bacteroidota bacterium]